MNHLSSSKSRLQASLGLAAVAAALYSASLTFVTAADPQAADAKKADSKVADSSTNSAISTNSVKPEKKVDGKKLTGAELYAINCNRCHAERYPPEFTSAQWQTIMLHMRVRANLPAAQSKLILQYLQEYQGK